MSILLRGPNSRGKDIGIAWLMLLIGTLTAVILNDRTGFVLSSIKGLELGGLSQSVICKRNYNSEVVWSLDISKIFLEITYL